MEERRKKGQLKGLEGVTGRRLLTGLGVGLGYPQRNFLWVGWA